jgi:hypothetical protein
MAMLAHKDNALRQDPGRWSAISREPTVCHFHAAYLTGPQTAVRGMKIGADLWLGCVLTTWATEYVFEVRTYALFAINTGFWLIGMVTMGAIVGAWKKK